MQNENNLVEAAQYLYYIAGALKSGVDARFLSQEHAAALFKPILRDMGFELPIRRTNNIQGGVEQI